MTTEQPWPESYPVKNVKVTMGMTLDEVDEAEYTDLRRQGLIDFGDDAPAPVDRRPAGQEG
jgi:hypothetical protein